MSGASAPDPPPSKCAPASLRREKRQEGRLENSYIKIVTLNYILSIELHHLTNKVFHHLRGVVRGWGNAQKLVSPGNSWIVDCLHVDVVATHHDVTYLCVFLSI